VQILEPRKKRPIINITSLIDVIFLLLIFFMVSSTFKEQPGMKLELPSSKSFERTEIKDLVLRVQKSGTDSVVFFLNSDPVELDSLPNLLKAALPKLKEETLTIKADKAIPHGTVVQVMDLAKQNGYKKLVIATKIQGN
jgi:biopolymer transport protein ExbD